MTLRNLRHALLALPLLLAPLGSMAQESKVRWKVKQNFDAAPNDGTIYTAVVRGDGSAVVAMKVNGTDPVIGGVDQGSLDRKFVSISTENVTELKMDNTKIVWGEGPVAVETIASFAGQVRVIASKPDPDKGQLLLIQQIINPRSLAGVRGAQLLTTIPYDHLGKGPDYFKANMAVGFTAQTAVDSSRILIGLTPASTRRSAGCPVFAMVFDKQMKPLWNNTLNTDASARSFQLVNTFLDPKGAVWYLVKNVSDPDPKAKEVLGYSYSIYRMDSAGQQSVQLDMAGKTFARDALMSMRPDGSIVVGGVYADDKTNRDESVGAFRCVFDTKAMKFDGFKLMPFEKLMVKKEEHWQQRMKIEAVLPKNDGGLFLVARKSGVETHYVSDLSGKKIPKTEQVDGQVHVWELDASGAQKWYHVVDHDLGYDNDVPGRMICTTYDNVLFILMNDNENNVEKRKQKMPVDPITSSKDALFFEFKPDGTDKEKVVMKEGFKQLGLQASQVWKVAPGTIVTLGSEGFGKDKYWPVVIDMGRDTKK